MWPDLGRTSFVISNTRIRAIIDDRCRPGPFVLAHDTLYLPLVTTARSP